ncbi:hypothetical protein BIW11_08271 [Tropilaelaps mercedesae]|uniref:Uncharacterized protein n=1 Tax=Tropilaelaps mercedesae TaxID=418985 RepID=A0A1V9XQN5_9ACAR|nr:hypothetical protein BIW11_08271 [Tropilaelaps mercedesae]
MDQTERGGKYKDFYTFSDGLKGLGRSYANAKQIESATMDDYTDSFAECPGDDHYNSETFNDGYVIQNDSVTEPWFSGFDRFKLSHEATTDLSKLKMSSDSALALFGANPKSPSADYDGSTNDLGSPSPILQLEGPESPYHSNFYRNDFDMVSSFHKQNSELRSFTRNLAEITIAVRLADVPHTYWRETDSRVDFANMVLQNVGLLESNANIQIVLSKLPSDVYVFDLAACDAERIVQFVTHYYPLVGASVLKGIRPNIERRDEITKNILDILEDTSRTEIQYTELIKSLEYPLTISLPIDYERLEEVNRADFHGILKKRTSVRYPTENLSSGHILKTVSLRKLSPIVHGLLKEAQEWLNHPVGSQNISKDYVIIPPPEGKNNVACLLNSKFLHKISQIIDETCPYDENAFAFNRSRNSYVTGEGELKPLEHLAACVPGIEVVWLNGEKCIRKLELNKLEETKKQEKNMLQEEYPETPAKGRQRSVQTRATTNQTPSKSTSPKQGRQTNLGKKEKPKEDKNQAEQKITKILSNILKDTKYQYIRFDKLEEVYATSKEKLEISGGLRKFVIEHVKHFQVLGEKNNEVVTLSHRAQIKRICNDIARLLRRRNPKCISSIELPSHLIELWQHNRDSEVLDVSHFGVCFLDDLMVTIPQHWGVHCSVYVSSSNGNLVLRQHGDGEEDVPDFVKLDCRVGLPGLSPSKPTHSTNGLAEAYHNNNIDNITNANQLYLEDYSVVQAWMPKHLRTEFQQKRSAFIMQQVLNMFRGDPTAADVVDFIENKIKDPLFNNSHASPERRSEISDMEKRLDTVCLRSNRPMYAPTAKHHVPLDFQISFNQFIPTFHHVSNSQAVVENYGAKTLFELFDNMADTFVLTHHEASLAKIRLTAEARRDVLERRLIYILRRAQRPLLTWELMHA